MAEQAATFLHTAGMGITKVDPKTPGLRSRGWMATTGISVPGRHYPGDAVLVTGGWTPLVHLWRHAGGKLVWNDARQAFLPDGALSKMQAIGAANGTYDLEEALIEARAAGSGETIPRAKSTYHITPIWPTPGSRGRQWIDLQHDVTLKDIEVAARENYSSVEHLKRYTTLGMASDQGKTSNMAGLAAMAALKNVTIPEVGTTTFRPPFVPIPLEVYHGQKTKQLYHPTKRLVLEPEHRAANAALCEYGGWLRPGWYGNGTCLLYTSPSPRDS